jgi:chemotaxis protein MotB
MSGFQQKVFLAMTLVAVLVFLAGCSCKEYEEQIMQLDAQIAKLQEEIANDEAIMAERQEIAEDLRANLKECNAEKAVLIEEAEEVVVITIPDELTFAASQVMVLDTMVPTLQAIANTISQYPDWDVYVEGYTDSRKILEEYQEYYPTNWELGGHRASAVVRYLTNDLGLSAERFAAVSFGPFRPVADNDTPEGRRANRRVRMMMYKPEM